MIGWSTLAEGVRSYSEERRRDFVELSIGREAHGITGNGVWSYVCG